MSEKQINYVLDSWALIAMLRDEKPASAIVRELVYKANREQVYLAISVINLGELFYIIGRLQDERAAERAIERLQQTALDICPVSQEDVMTAARFKMTHSISYADSFAVAAAVNLEATLVTGDPELKALSHLVDILPLDRN